jgi:NADP-dependent 3-hydroxy acid dehydrogenase YdfG
MTNSYPFSVSSEEFKDKRILVTGGTKGVGEAIVRRFQLSGALVATTARSPSLHDQTANLFVQADLATASGVYSVADRIRQEWGELDVLVNNVGGTETKPGGFEVLSDEDWQETLELNLMAAVRLDRVFIPGMIERRSGVVIHISSIAHRMPFSNSTLAYATAHVSSLQIERDSSSAQITFLTAARCPLFDAAHAEITPLQLRRAMENRRPHVIKSMHRHSFLGMRVIALEQREDWEHA